MPPAGEARNEILRYNSTAHYTRTHTVADYFPFQLTALPAAGFPDYPLAIFADVGGLADYYDLFQHYGFGGTAASWSEHLQTIVEEHQPQLFEELEFAEDGHPFIVYAASQAAAEQFLACVLPYFGSLPRLQQYLCQADPSNFFA